MKVSIRDLLLVTVIVALAGCKTQDGDDIQYCDPGPEFRLSREAGKDGDLSNSQAPVPNPPKDYRP